MGSNNVSRKVQMCIAQNRLYSAFRIIIYIPHSETNTFDKIYIIFFANWMTEKFMNIALAVTKY